MIDIEKLAWDKMSGLLPAIIQDEKTCQVLMMGYMNREALNQTVETKQVTFYSRSKERLWIKGETSGNFLKLKSITEDCDGDSLLLFCEPAGPTCHKGTTSCFCEAEVTPTIFFEKLQQLIKRRNSNRPENSYTSELFDSGIKRIAQKVGEEGVEVALAAVCETKEKLCAESADLIYHLLVLLEASDLSWRDVIEKLSVFK